MKARDIRSKFIEYFKKQEHIVVPSASLIPNNDPSVLLTTAGMQQFKPYFLGEKDPEKDFGSRRLTSVQQCFRTSDIDSVGDTSHLTFFEMLGNFSVGDYSKEGAIRMAWECMTNVLKLPKQKLFITVFAGDATNVKDFEAVKLWTAYVEPSKISEHPRSANWWGPPGTSGPCGPCSEIHFDLTGKPCERGTLCVPNCPCNRFIEIWNLVFMEYYQDETGAFSALPKKNIDTGMGLERLTMVAQKADSVYDTDLFTPLFKAVLHEADFGQHATADERTTHLRIAADHLKGAVFLAANGVQFSNKDQGYILRRIFRRALDQFTHPRASFPGVVETVISEYEDAYPFLRERHDAILQVLTAEADHYVTHVSDTIKKVTSKHYATGAADNAAGTKHLTADEAFTLYATHGTPLDRLKKEGFTFDEAAVEKKIEEHKTISRAGATGKFGGHGLNYSLNATHYSPADAARMTRLHTATHLLHQALRTILGKHVQQNGSDITPERLRFDFTHPAKVTPEQLQQVAALVNEQVARKLPVVHEEMDLNKALTSGALSFFKERYPERVTVYSMGDFSKEICGGPHVSNTEEVGTFVIQSEKSSSAGIRRIKATVQP